MAYVSFMPTFCFLVSYLKVIILVNTFRAEPKHYPVHDAVIIGIYGIILYLLFERSGVP